jgi:hypothetical protein
MRRRAQEVDGGGHGELRGAEVGGEVAAADLAALFQGLEHVVDGGEAAGKVFGVGGLAEDDAVAGEELLRDGVAPLGLRGGGVAGFVEGSEVERPSALRGGRRGAAASGSLWLWTGGWACAARLAEGLFAVGAEGVEGVVGEQAAPDEDQMASRVSPG